MIKLIENIKPSPFLAVSCMILKKAADNFSKILEVDGALISTKSRYGKSYEGFYAFWGSMVPSRDLTVYPTN